MASKEEDVAATKMVRALFAKRGVDVSRADLRVSHGVLTVRGLVTAIKGVDFPDLRVEVENLGKILRGKQNIRDVVIDCNYR